MVEYVDVGTRPKTSSLGEGRGEVKVEKVIGEELVVVVTFISLRCLLFKIPAHQRLPC